MDSIRSIRNVRSEKQVPPGKKVPAIIQAEQQLQDLFGDWGQYITELASLSELELTVPGAAPEKAEAIVATGYTIYLPLAGLVDLEQEIAKLEKELAGAREQLGRVENKLANADFVQKAPAHVVEREQKRKQELEALIANLEKRLHELED